MVRPFLSSLFLSLVFSFTYSQQYYFSNFSIEQGLSQSVINCVVQDSRGYMWMGTQNGLNKFNGYTFEVYSYKPTDPYSLSNNWIYSMTEDREGNFWIGTKSGLNKFDIRKKRFERIRYHPGYPNEIGEYVYDVIISKKGLVLINTPPVLSVFDPKTNEFNHYVNNLPFDEAVKDNRIPLLEDFDGQIWVGSTRGLSCFDPKTKKFTNYLTDDSSPFSISDNTITALFEDKNKTLWIGTSNGLNKFDKRNKTFLRFFHDPKNEISLSGNFIRAITADKSGNLWIGTEGQGLNKMFFSNYEKPVFDRFTSEKNLISSNIILALQIDKSENLWMGTLQGVSKTDLKKRKFQLYRRSLSPYSVDLLGNVIASIYNDDHDILWIGNWGQGLNLYNRKTGAVEHFSSHHTKNHNLPNDYVHVIFEDSQKRIWLGTRDGIFIYQKEKNAFSRLNTFFSKKGLPGFNGIRKTFFRKK
jgi:ligand-binding sensor domain-containing protein